MNDWTELGVGACFILLVLQQIFSFLNKKNGPAKLGAEVVAIRALIEAKLPVIEEQMRDMRDELKQLRKDLTEVITEKKR